MQVKKIYSGLQILLFLMPMFILKCIVLQQEIIHLGFHDEFHLFLMPVKKIAAVTVMKEFLLYILS